MSIEEISKTHNKKIVKETIEKVNKNEHKRYQLCPTLKLSKKAFGTGRRIPISAENPY
tara:strand:+ start:122 stop:295 length:174 start_codon:yes stop_codon:yes gene_type:complete